MPGRVPEKLWNVSFSRPDTVSLTGESYKLTLGTALVCNKPTEQVAEKTFLSIRIREKPLKFQKKQ